MSRPLFPAEIEFNEIMMDGNHISPTTFEALHRFTLLFSLFEAKLLNCEGSQGKSGQYATDFIAKGLVDVAHLDSSYGYFENRYSDANHGKGKYQTLCGNRGGELGNVVNKIINSASPSIEEKLTACLFIAFRLRNNLFHGPKWLYNMAYQVDNFDAASQIIQSILRISRHNHMWNSYS